MIRSRTGLVLAAFIQVIFGQVQEFRPPNVPRHCLTLPPGIDIHKCCPIPSLYPDEVMDHCGIKKRRPGEREAPRESPKVPCKEGICLMQQADLLMANQSVDYEKLGAFVDYWAVMNPAFKDAIMEAKKICVKDGGPLGPPICEHDKVFLCLSSSVLWNCNLQDLGGSSGCSILKAHIDECKPHFMRWREQQEQNLPKLN